MCKDVSRDILRLYTFLQNLHEPSISNSSCNNQQSIFAQIYKPWLILSSAAHPRSLYFAAAYRLAMFRPTCKKSKMKHSPASHNKRAQKSKIKNTQTQKIDASHNDHIFYHTATAPRIMLLAAFFTWVCSSQTRSFAATQQKIVFIIFKILMFTLVRFVLCPIAISVIILLKVNARLWRKFVHLCLCLLCLSWVQAYVCVLHAARDNRCAYYIVVILTIPPAIVVLFVHHNTYAFVLCTCHRFA